MQSTRPLNVAPYKEEEKTYIIHYSKNMRRDNLHFEKKKNVSNKREFGENNAA